MGVAAAVALAAAVLLSACGSGTSAPVDASGLPIGRAVTRADLARLPDANLRYPGSTVVKLVGMNQTPNGDPEEPDPAYTGAILTAKATAAQLFAWYESMVARNGFAPAVYLRPSDQSSGEAWAFHHRLQIQVGVFDPALLKADTGISVRLPSGETVYQAILVGYVPGLPKY